LPADRRPIFAAAVNAKGGGMKSIRITLGAMTLIAWAGFGGAVGQAIPATGAPAAISLEVARARALERNPALLAAGSDSRAAEGAWRQARAWPNPELEVAAEEFGGDRPGWDDAILTWSVTERLEIFGSRGARARAGRFGYDAATAERERMRLEVSAEVERRFAAVIAAQDRLAALAESDQISAGALATVRALVEAGEVSPVEAERTEAERARVGIAYRTADVDLANARRALAQLWGEATPDFTRAEGTLEFVPVVPSLESLESLVAGGLVSPDLRRRDAEVSRGEAARSLARLGRWPEVSLSAGLRRFSGTGERTCVASIGLALPLLDRNGGAIQQADAEVARLRTQRRQEEVRLAGDLAAARDALENAAHAAETMRESVLPRTATVHAALSEGYRRGEFRLLDLLDAQRTWVEARLQYIDVLESLWSARADLERLLGRSLAARAQEGESR
jgi:cobalt-zinc-cadmium efflux system outer membrane protein